jgi:hypothetical protein
MLETAIDHLVITASSREVGSAHVASVLGAANPRVPPPLRPRWFDLDHVPVSAPPASGDLGGADRNPRRDVYTGRAMRAAWGRRPHAPQLTPSLKHRRECRMGEAPDFSRNSKEYAASRPLYPPELFDWLASSVHDRTAWDAAAGSSQAALRLATHFSVFATDISPGQLEHAVAPDRMPRRFRRGITGRGLGRSGGGRGYPWFDLDRFWEVRRVIRREACWPRGPSRSVIAPPLDRVLWPFYRMLSDATSRGARMVDARYEGLTLPEWICPPRPSGCRCGGLRRRSSIRQTSVVSRRTAATKRISGADRENSPGALGSDNSIQK